MCLVISTGFTSFFQRLIHFTEPVPCLSPHFPGDRNQRSAEFLTVYKFSLTIVLRFDPEIVLAVKKATKQDHTIL